MNGGFCFARREVEGGLRCAGCFLVWGGCGEVRRVGKLGKVGREG